MHVIVLDNPVARGARIMITKAPFIVADGRIDFHGPTRYWDYAGADRTFDAPVVSVTSEEKVRVFQA